MNKLKWVTKLAEAESSGNAEAVQKLYEKLFALCHDKHLDLTALLREAEESRHAKGRVMFPDATSPVKGCQVPGLPSSRASGMVTTGSAIDSRDTFAVGLVHAGVPTEHVSVLFGHSRIKGAERYFSTWVRARQE